MSGAPAHCLVRRKPGCAEVVLTSAGPAMNGRMAIAAPVMAGLTLRLLWAWLVPVAPVSDSFIYDEFARSIVAGRGFAFADGTLTAFWPPGTSALYALLYMAGGGFRGLTALNILLGVGIILLTYGLAKRHIGPGVALAAAWIIACWPLLIQFTTILASELLFTFLILATVYVWGSRALPLVWRSLSWGALLAAAIYVRPTALPLFVLLPMLEYWRERDWRVTLISIVVASLTAATAFAPWVERNNRLFDRFVLVSTNFGPNLWMGNNPNSDGGYMALPETGLGNEAESDSFFMREAVEFIRENPASYARLVVNRLIMTYGRETIGVSWNEGGISDALSSAPLLPLKAVSTGYWWLLLLLSGVGVIANLNRPAGWLNPLAVVGGFFFLVPVLTVGGDRYHVPVTPFIAMLAAVGLTCLSWRFPWLRPSWGGGGPASVPVRNR
jgi:4-amino-4-deoxy-L-arabinose transferase-like glycosyltransferase